MSTSVPVATGEATALPVQDDSAPRRAARYYELDLLRFVAAASVMIYHWFFRAGLEHPALARNGFGDPWHIFRYGYLGMELFFMISGFVILNSAWRKPPGTFVASRISRLYPTFWAALAITTLVVMVDPERRFAVSLRDWFVNLTMAPQLFGAERVDGVYWTLLVELKFYLMIFALCLVGLTVNRIYAFAVAWLAISIFSAHQPLPGPLAELLVPQWSAFFVAGVLFALIAREGWKLRFLVPLAVSAWWCKHVIVALATTTMNGTYHSELSLRVVTVIVASMFAAFAVIVSGKLRVPGARWVVALGALTYPLYLLHENIGFVLFNVGYGRMSRWLLLALVTGIVVGLSWALHITVERHLSPRLNRWLRQHLNRVGPFVAGVLRRPTKPAEVDAPPAEPAVPERRAS